MALKSQQLIIALDYDKQSDALNLVDQLDPSLCALKVGSELFTLFGTQFVKELVSRNFPVFLDLKFHDIPNTVARACKAGADLGVWMMNVHASGGMKMMQAAREAIEPFGTDKPLLIAVTILTSFNEAELATVGINNSLKTQVKQLAVLAKESGLDGVVSSAFEVVDIKQSCGADFLTVTPGIRLDSNSKDDQSRVMTPAQAIKAGSDYLVIGRPITQAKNPAQTVDLILSSLYN